jgi:prephenate dehydrogenase
MQHLTLNNTERNIIIVGVGLIGGSIAAAVRQRFPDWNVVGIGRNRERLESAQKAGLLTSWSDTISCDTIPDGSLAIVCLPVHQIADAVRQLFAAGCQLVTDAGSVKASVYAALGSEADRRFVGSHPIAGSEQSGFEHSDANLFSNRLCIVTIQPAVNEDDVNVQRVVSFWKSLNASVHLMTPEEHDRVLALTSHLPHILASVAAGCVEPDLLTFTGTGYRDTTRIAAGSASLWASILLGNARCCVEAIDSAEHLLQQFRDAISKGDATQLEAIWEAAAQRRRSLTQHG